MSTDKPKAIVVKNLHKSFRLPHEQHNGIKQLVVNFAKRQKGYEVQKVLTDVSFDIEQGDFFGIVGRNGSGKSTLLKLLAQIYVPDSGQIQVNGSLTPFIELGVGFNPELTGRENVFMNGALLGFDNNQMNEMYGEIVEFAELENFMDQKLKNYSSGMQVRLAFSIAIRAKSDILLLDEVLAVGDAIFQKKCYDYFKELKKDKRTVIFVSHDVSALQEYCTKAILIENGKIIKQGEIEKVITAYTEILNKSESDKYNDIKKPLNHIGTGNAVITDVTLYSATDDQNKTLFTQDDKDIGIDLTIDAKDSIVDPIYGVTIYDSAGQRVFTCNNMWSHIKHNNLAKGDRVIAKFLIPNIFNSGTFTVSPAIASEGGAATHDVIDSAAEFRIRKKQVSNAYTNTEYKLHVRKV